MDHQQWSLRLGAGVIFCALLLRLTATGFFQPVADFLAKPNIAAFLIYLETGRIVRFSPSSDTLEAFARESPAPDFARGQVLSTEPTLPEKPSFSAADGEAVEIKNSGSAKFDAGELITRPLTWDLTAPEPTVLILHTHTTESYTKVKGETYKETSAFRTLDEAYNMTCVGEHLAQLLEAGGVRVIHDRELHDYPSYNGSYNHARKEIKAYLKEYPSICLVLDLHRDASEDLNNQMRTHAVVDGEDSAQLMLVVASGSSTLKHPDWEENMALALKLHTQAERLAPGICRKLNVRPQRFNQDLSTGALLVEVGAAGNTRAEALLAVEVLADAVLALAEGSPGDAQPSD